MTKECWQSTSLGTVSLYVCSLIIFQHVKDPRMQPADLPIGNGKLSKIHSSSTFNKLNELAIIGNNRTNIKV